MIIKNIVSVEGEFAKKGEDINPGETVTIVDPGQNIDGQFGEQFVIKVKTKNGDKNVNFNKTTLNILAQEFGVDTAHWVGKGIYIREKKMVIDGKKVDAYYFVTPEWNFDEYGELVKAGATAQPTASPEPVSPEDIPF